MLPPVPADPDWVSVQVGQTVDSISAETVGFLHSYSFLEDNGNKQFAHSRIGTRTRVVGGLSDWDRECWSEGGDFGF